MMAQLNDYSLKVIPARCSLLPLISICGQKLKPGFELSTEQVVHLLYLLLLACAHPSMYTSVLL